MPFRLKGELVFSITIRLDLHYVVALGKYLLKKKHHNMLLKSTLGHSKVCFHALYTNNTCSVASFVAVLSAHRAANEQ